MEAEATDQIDAAVREADQDPFPPLEDRYNDILAERYPLQK
jgi:TPP-dependent pyruvate/acetoin dehydrogenase alpha subunit